MIESLFDVSMSHVSINTKAVLVAHADFVNKTAIMIKVPRKPTNEIPWNVDKNMNFIINACQQSGVQWLMFSDDGDVSELLEVFFK